MRDGSLFQSFFMAGFECSSHRRPDGRRLDLVKATGHDRFARSDYAAIAAHGLLTARDGLRWHLIETSPGQYDWSTAWAQVRAAREAGVQVIWDLCHYGWPEDLDIWSPEFVGRLAEFARAAARFLRDETASPLLFCPVNEISYFAWAGGEVGKFFPGGRRRGAELKRQLVRAAVAAIEAVREVDPGARFVWAEPAIHLDPGEAGPGGTRGAENYRLAQFEAFDMLCGRLFPELGGRADFLDIVGVNFYPHNQWYFGGGTIPMGHHAYRPFRAMLAEVHARYGRPMIIAETGAEGTARAAWLHYVASEVSAAISAGVPIHGICLYPVTDYPGWDNERRCDVGLLLSPDEQGVRSVHAPLAEEIDRQRALLASGAVG